VLQYGKDSFESYVKEYGRDSGRRDLLTKVLSVKPGTGESALTDRETYMEVSNLVFAGTGRHSRSWSIFTNSDSAQDTTSTTLTYMFWELARNPLWQDRLRKELVARLPANEKMLPRFRELDDLPVLDAVINEALRLHPAAPASLQRETPVGGKVLNGYYIPEKVEFSIR